MTSHRLLGLSVPLNEVLDPALWKQRYAYGIALGATNFATAAERRAAVKAGKKLNELIDEIPQDVIRWHLRVALSELELKVGVPMGVQVVKSMPLDDNVRQGVDYDVVRGRIPYTRAEAGRWFRIDLPANVISVERVRAYYFGRKVWEFSQGSSGIVLQWPKPGVLHLIPRELEGVIVVDGGNYGVWETVNIHTSPVPDFWSVDYTTGPVDRDGQAGRIPAVAAHWVACAAGILLLSIGGLATSKGLTSTSVSMDGVSRSVSLQASAIYGINSALEHAYDEATKRINWKQLRTSMRGLRVFMFGH